MERENQSDSLDDLLGIIQIESEGEEEEEVIQTAEQRMADMYPFMSSEQVIAMIDKHGTGAFTR